MYRRQFSLCILGLALAVSAAGAAVPSPVMILGQEYTVSVSPRYGTFKNGVTVHLQKGGGAVSDADVIEDANLCFAPGATQSEDRLFVVAPTQDAAGPTSDGFYMLRGTDTNGAFTPQDSDATVFFRGNISVHGRPQNVTWINDADTGVKRDRNIYMMTLTGANFMRWYDLDTLIGRTINAYRELAVFSLKEPGDVDATEPPDPANPFIDPNAPAGDLGPGALAPKGMMITAGTDSGSIAIGVIDPVNGQRFFPVKTDLVMATGGMVDRAQQPNAFVRLTGDEYLMIATDPSTGASATESDLKSQTLYHLRITLPADLTREAPNSIKVELLDKQDLPKLGLGQSPTHKIQGIAVGRELAPGKPVLYMADWAGNIFTLRPNVTASPAAQ